jgi:hypothetical protein
MLGSEKVTWYMISDDTGLGVAFRDPASVIYVYPVLGRFSKNAN